MNTRHVLAMVVMLVGLRVAPAAPSAGWTIALGSNGTAALGAGTLPTPVASAVPGAAVARAELATSPAADANGAANAV